MIHRLLPLVLVLAAACSSGGSTCVLETAQGEPMACIDYDSRLSDSDVRASCEAGGGSVASDGCDDATAVARCESLGSSTWYYPAYLTETATTLPDLQAACEAAGGTFTTL